MVADTKIIKFNPKGDTLWTKEYPNLGDIVITTDLVVNSVNDIIFTGYGIVGDSWDYFTQKISSSGQDIWTETFNSDEKLDDYGMSLALDMDDNIFITGGSSDHTSVGYCYTIKYSNEGILKWKYKFDTPHSKFKYGNSIFVDDSNNVFIGGDLADSINGWNFFAFKISQDFSTGINILEDNILRTFSLSQNYPNPFNPSTIIKYTIPKLSFVSLKVYDLLGREIATLVNEEKESGTYEVEFDAINLSSGIYFYKMRAGAFTDIKKLILIR